MNRKTRNWLVAAAGVVVAAGAGGYWFMNDYLGNRVEIVASIPASSAAANTGTGEEKAVVAGNVLDGEWRIAEASKVYFSVTTSRETVNFENSSVSGSWTIDLEQPELMKAEGTLVMSEVHSGNAQRDGHLQSEEFFNVAEYPQAVFTATSFAGLPKAWEEGAVYDFQMTGTLTVKGIAKEVTFDAKALYEAGQVRLSGETIVTFIDFGMENPHSVVLDTENDISVRLELVLEK